MAAPGNNVDVKGAMNRLITRFNETVSAKYAALAEQTAKDNAPWKDQTGDARKLLKGKTIDDGEAIGIQLVHRVEYGKHLETAHSGRYAILKPTIEGLRERFFQAARQVFGGAG
jgi:hypothetical protein